jgi:carboxymethylenebutenolidase
MDIQLNVNGKSVTADLALPASGKGPGVLVLHAWWGLNPFFKNLCAQLAEQGFVVLAPDLNNGEVVHQVAEAEELMERRDYQFMEEIVQAAKDFLLSHPACANQKLGIVGFSMGAAWALSVAASAPEQVAAVVLFYGSNRVDISKIQSKILGHFSDVDAWEPFDEIQAMEKEMLAAGVDVTFHSYPGRAHWFMEDDRPEYDPESAKLAWDRTVAFLKNNL